MRLLLVAVLLAIFALAPALRSQHAVGDRDSDRVSSTWMVFNDRQEALAGVSIGYGRPTWRSSYDDMLEQLRGSNYTRIGKGWWTTMDTIGALEIGGQRVEAGSYYLGIAVGVDGAFSLLIFDSKAAMKAGLLPHTTALYTGAVRPMFRAPLTLAKGVLQEPVLRLEIEVAAPPDDPAGGRFAIRWGSHELSAPIRLELVAKADTTPAEKK